MANGDTASAIQSARAAPKVSAIPDPDTLYAPSSKAEQVRRASENAKRERSQ